MNIRTMLAGVVAGTVLVPGIAAAQEDESQMIEITEIDLKAGHWRKFADGMESYISCYEEEGGEGSWSAWWDVEHSTIHLVSQMDGWAEMDERDEASMKCWSVIEEEISPHITDVETSFARSLPDWSGDAEGYDVVRLHRFRVDDGRAFRETVGTITGILKEAEYEHLGSWYDVIGNDAGEPDYFVVAHYENFAAMDEDRAGPYRTVVDAEGEERADELWAQFGDSLHDDWEYSTLLLSRSSDLGYSPDAD
ncbi:MAG: hypothetical protein ACNS61_12680 [Candidatus Wenzhouxiangella sp. M2_3B_020]